MPNDDLVPLFHPNGPTFYELAVQALSSTRHGYDLLAPKFDWTPFRTPPSILKAVAPHLAARGPYRDGIDVCCGTGVGMTMLRPLCSERVVGIDFSPGMLDVCQQNTADAPGSARLEYVEGDVLAMPFGADFDVAVCFGALGHIPRRDEDRFVSEVARVLRPGGRFAFVTGNMPPVWSPVHVAARAFNGAMWLRNVLFQPPFIMFYLTFMLPAVAKLLKRHGMTVEVVDLALERPFRGLKLVIGTRA